MNLVSIIFFVWAGCIFLSISGQPLPYGESMFLCALAAMSFVAALVLATDTA